MPVTFLFTDVEGSSGRWEADPDAMTADLAHHDRILRATVEANRGTVFKHTGDGLCSTFPAAHTAVRAAVACQVRMAQEKWQGPGPLRVRMAIHTGSAVAREGDWFGPTLNRVARIMATAHGEQVVCSQATADLVAGRVPEGVSLRDLGDHRLAGLSQPERIFQVVHPDLRREFPPLRAVPAAGGRLPAALSSFVGRDGEAGEVGRLLAESRLVTLTGIGGVGKTRLALRVAEQAVPAHPDGVFLVELAPLTDPSLLPASVRTALGLASAAGDPETLLVRLVEHLAPRRLLLVVDNCEHLVGDVAALAGVLLARCPDLRVLATSQEPLGLPGEVAWRVPSLSLPRPGEAAVTGDAVSLFCERARQANPAFRLTPQTVAPVTQICLRLDGIPLALELAAARLGVLGVEEVAARLDDRFRLLAGGPRQGLARHRTLRAALDWSHELLSEPEQALLRHLAVFRGSFTLGAAEVVGAGVGVDSDDVLDLLARLVDKSWVGVEAAGPETRYRLLESVRQYAEEHLARAGEVEAARHRHQQVFLDLARTGWGDPWLLPARWLRRLAADHDNFRAALEWAEATGDADSCLEMAAALYRYWNYGGHTLESQTWRERALAAYQGAPRPALVNVLNGLGFQLLTHGQAKPAQVLHERAFQMALSIGDGMGATVAQAWLGFGAFQRGDSDSAEQLLGEARHRALAAGSPAGAAWCDFTVAWAALPRGDLPTATARLEAALAYARGEGSDDPIHVHALAGLAPLAAVAGQEGRAWALAKEAVDRGRALGLRQVLIMALVRAAETAVVLERLEPARAWVAESLGLLREIGGEAWVADALELAALVAGAEGRADVAARSLASAFAVRQAAGEDPATRLLHRTIESCSAWAHEELGDAAFNEARATAENLGAQEAVARLLADFGEES